MLYGTDTHPNMAPARYKQPVARQLLSEVGNPNAAVFGCMIEFRSG